MKTLLYDAHAHMGTEEERTERSQKGIRTLMCAACLAEAPALAALAEEEKWVLPTYGLHPWHAAEDNVNDLLPYLESCGVIGEIGMDSVWCDVPLSIQEKVFREQLALAIRMGKPAILHTKGEEARIASILREYPNTYLVHWYSADNGLEDYADLNCYYTIGPDVWWNPAVAQAAASVPLDRLLIETDGLGAVAWANEAGGRKAEEGERGLSVYHTLMESTACIARIRGVTEQEMLQVLADNFERFLSLGRF